MNQNGSPSVLCIAAMFLGFFVVGCGGPKLQDNFQNGNLGTPTSPSSTSFSITLLPASVNIIAGQQVSFTTPFVGNVIWAVNGIVGGNSVNGTVDAAGNYTAPAVAPTAPVTITAQLGAFTSATSASAKVTVFDSGQVSATGNPLVAAYTITVPSNSSVSVDFGLDTRYGFQTSQFTAPPGGGAVRALIAGMKPSLDYHMRATLQLPGGTLIQDADHVFRTGTLSALQVPQLNVTHFGVGTESSGIQLLDGLNTSTSNFQLCAVDRDGNVVWYYDNAIRNTAPPSKLVWNGDFVIENFRELLEVNLAGETVRSIPISSIQTALSNAGYTFTLNTVHHDFELLPNKHFILLTETTKNIMLAGANSPVAMNGDVVIDLDPDLNVVWVWNEFDHLDVNRQPMGSVDWTHSNALVYLPRDGNLLVSSRSQSWIIKVDYRNGTGSGNILWKLGYQGDFALVGGNEPTDWFFLQHYPHVIDDSAGKMTLAIFDNGNQRIMDGEGDICGTGTQIPCYSRGIIMSIDESTMIANLDWKANPGLYSWWGGSIQQLANGDIIADFNALPFGARIMEFSPDTSAQPVWQLDVIGQVEYRSLRLPSLYPGVSWP